MRTNRLMSTLAVAVPFVLPGLALAADAGHEGAVKGELLGPLKQGLPAMIAAFIVFGVVFAVLAWKVWPVILKGLDEREAKIRSAIEEAETARQQAKQALEQYQRDLAEARAKAQKDLEAARAQQAVLAAEARAASDREIALSRERALREIDVAKKAALSEIYANTATLATSVASRVLQREVNSGDTDRLVADAITTLKL